MENVLIYANTHMQIINAIQIKLKIHEGDNVDIIISDHSRGGKEVAECLADMFVFRNVYYVRTSFKEFKQNKLSDLADIILISLSITKKYKKVFSLSDMKYDKVYFYNKMIFLYPILDDILRVKKTVEFICFEEGLSSYRGMLTKSNSLCLNIIEKWRRLLHKKIVSDLQNTYCCYYPDLLKEQGMRDEIIRPALYFDKDCKILKNFLSIPYLQREDKSLIDILNKIYKYNEKNVQYKAKYIYFSTSSDIDGFNIGETELVMKIANMVGKENLLVKTHPRDRRKIYEDNGLTVIQEAGVPWEVIQLNHDFRGHIFLSMASGSVLSATAMLGDNIATWYLWNCVRDNNKWLRENIKRIEETLKALQKKGVCKSIHIAEQLSDFVWQNEGAL